MSDKPIRYCKHLEERLVYRRVDRELPERIIRNADRVYNDRDTGYRIAIGKVKYRGKEDRLMMVVFEETPEEIVAVTIHPLDERDVASKLRIGRWES